MEGRPRCLPLVALVLALAAGACGDDDEATTAAPSTTGVATTTTAPWGTQVAPGAEAMLEGSQVLLREDFQDGDTAGWQVDSGWFILENGDRRAIAAGGEAWAWYEDGLEWSRYGARLGFVLNEGSVGVSVAVGPQGRYLVHLTADGVYLLKDAPYGSYQSLGSAQPVALGEPHVLALGLDGGHLQVYVDGRLLIDARDPGPLPGGSVGLGAEEGGRVVVDNIVVAGLGGPLPQLGEVSEPADNPLPDSLADGAPNSGEGLDDGAAGEAGLPNLVISGISYPMEVRAGEPFDVMIATRNVGAAAAVAFDVSFTSDETGCVAEVDGLGIGEQASVVCEFPGYGRDGDYEWLVRADSDRQVEEGAFEGDNEAAGVIFLGGNGSADLPNVSVSWATGARAISPGEAIRIEIGIEQTDTEWAAAVPTLEYAVVYEDGSPGCGSTVTAGAWRADCLLPGFPEAGDYLVRATIDAGGVLAESDEADNTVEVTINVVGVPREGLPNLYPGAVVYEPDPPRAGEAFEVVVWQYADNAPIIVGPHTIRFLIDGVLVCERVTESSSLGMNCTVDGLAAGIHRWEAHFDTEDDIVESDETDNSGFGQFTVEG